MSRLMLVLLLLLGTQGLFVTSCGKPETFEVPGSADPDAGEDPDADESGGEEGEDADKDSGGSGSGGSGSGGGGGTGGGGSGTGEVPNDPCKDGHCNNTDDGDESTHWCEDKPGELCID